MNRIVNICITVALLLMLVVGAVLAAGTATLTATDPTTRTDGSAFNPAVDASKHTLYYGLSSATSPTVYDTKVDYGATATSYTVNSLPSGTIYFVVTITDKANQESAPSNRAAKYFAPAKPNACSLSVN